MKHCSLHNVHTIHSKLCLPHSHVKKRPSTDQSPSFLFPIMFPNTAHQRLDSAYKQNTPSLFHWTGPSRTSLHRTIPYVLYCTVYCTLLSWTLLTCTVLNCIYGAALYSTAIDFFVHSRQMQNCGESASIQSLCMTAINIRLRRSAHLQILLSR